MDKALPNVRIADNGSCFMVTVDGLCVNGFNSLGNAWRHIEWMYAVASQKFTVGEKRVPVKEWIRNGERNGWLDTHYSEYWDEEDFEA